MISPCKHDMLLWPAQTEPSAKLWLWESAWSPSVRMVIKHGHWNSTNGGFSGKHITFIKMLDILLPCLIEGTIELDCTVPICSSRITFLWAGRRGQGPELIASCWIDAVFTLRICSVFCTMPHVQGRPMSFPSTRGSQALIPWWQIWCCLHQPTVDGEALMVILWPQFTMVSKVKVLGLAD